MFSCALNVIIPKVHLITNILRSKWSELLNYCESYELKKNSRWSEVTSILTARIKIAITQKNQIFEGKEKIRVSYILMQILFCEFDEKP